MENHLRRFILIPIKLTSLARNSYHKKTETYLVEETEVITYRRKKAKGKRQEELAPLMEEFLTGVVSRLFSKDLSLVDLLLPTLSIMRRPSRRSWKMADWSCLTIWLNEPSNPWLWDVKIACSLRVLRDPSPQPLS